MHLSVCVCYYGLRGAYVCSRTGVDNLLFLTKGHPGAFPSPLGPLDVQVALLDRQGGDALVVGRVELCQVLPGNGKESRSAVFTKIELGCHPSH